jgi:hypothetical protein
MSSLADLYRAERRQQSASMIYQEPLAPAPRPQIYVEAPVRDYSTPPPSKYGHRVSESDYAYVARLKPLLQHLTESLPQAELATVAQQYNDAVTRIEQGGGPQTGQQLREQLAARQTGTGRGIYGDATPQQRAQAVGRFGGRQVEANGTASVEPISDGRPASVAEISAIMREREQQRQGQQPMRQEIPEGSSGTGIFIR